MTLQGKDVVIFAATGAIGSVTARKVAAEGAHVWLSGRDRASVDALVQEVRTAGGTAQGDVVDATDEDAVNSYVARVVQSAGKIDGTFNAIGGRPQSLGYPAPALTTSLEDFMRPANVILLSTFLTSRIVARSMAERKAGSIVTLTATLSSMTAPFMAGITATSAAIEGLTRSLAGEFGPAGIRVNCVRGNGMPETRTIQETVAGYIELGYAIPMALPPLGRPITVAETAAAAAFLLSDHASGMTGQVVTVSAGAFVD
jgi:NAD(P)-dependent dehydrogenase (short-subunit alcohol dehydrogenase family)